MSNDNYRMLGHPEVSFVLNDELRLDYESNQAQGDLREIWKDTFCMRSDEARKDKTNWGSLISRRLTIRRPVLKDNIIQQHYQLNQEKDRTC